MYIYIYIIYIYIHISFETRPTMTLRKLNSTKIRCLYWRTKFCTTWDVTENELKAQMCGDILWSLGASTDIFGPFWCKRSSLKLWLVVLHRGLYYPGTWDYDKPLQGSIWSIQYMGMSPGFWTLLNRVENYPVLCEKWFNTICLFPTPQPRLSSRATVFHSAFSFWNTLGICMVQI